MYRWLLTTLLLVLLLMGCTDISRRPLSAPSRTPTEPVTRFPTVPAATEIVAPGGSPSPMPVERSTPTAGDEQRRGPVYLESAQVLVRESHPPQIVLALRGQLPTPCHDLRVVVQPPDAQHHIQVEVYSLPDEGKICAQVLTPFEVQLPFETYPSGHYTVLVNGEPVGEFDT